MNVGYFLFAKLLFRLQLQGEAAVGVSTPYRGMLGTAVGVIKEEVSNFFLF